MTVIPAGPVEAHLDRLDRLNPRLNAVIADRASQVSAASGAAGSAARGPLAGVVFTVKDVIATRDLPTTAGSRLLDVAGLRDAPAVARMRAAGAVLLGKTNCPEFALGVHTDNSRYGRTHNPLGPFTVGGSSGGEAAAVAAGISAVGLGTDFGGSLRWPAQCAGLVGLRPTVARVPAAGQFPWLAGEPDRRTLQGRVQVIGPIGRTVADVAAVFGVLTGGTASAVSGWPVPPAELRWGMVGSVDRAIEDALEWAAGVLERSGVATAAGLPATIGHAAEAYDRLRAADPMDAVAALARGHEDLLDPRTRALLAARTLGEHAAPLWTVRHRLIGELAHRLRGDRVLLLPVSLRPPFPPPAPGTPPDPAEFDVLQPCRAVSLFGWPALSVPAPPTAAGRPVSVQIVAPPRREDLLFAAAARIEEARLCAYR